MAHHKNQEHLNRITEVIHSTDKLNESEKSESVKRIEEWVVEDKAFGTLQAELIKISEFFEEIFSELGLK